MKKVTLLISVLFSSILLADSVTLNLVSCIARKHGNTFKAEAYGYGNIDFEIGVEESLGAFDNVINGTGYCQSIKVLNSNEVEFKTVKIVNSQPPVIYEMPCNFKGENINLSIDKQVVSVSSGHYAYSLADGEHPFGSGDIIEIQFFPDLEDDDNQYFKKLSAKCQRIVDSLNLK